jgi:ABC-2 type transport system ATP-binding protein
LREINKASRRIPGRKAGAMAAPDGIKYSHQVTTAGLTARCGDLPGVCHAGRQCRPTDNLPHARSDWRKTMDSAIETRGLTRYFGPLCAVDRIDLKVERGISYGFLGPNGAGKSTTIKMLTGLLSPSDGEISVLGRNVLNPSEALQAKQHVGVVPEDLGLFDNLTAREYLTFVGRMYLIPPATIRTRIDDLLGVMDLANENKKLTLEYSHGMKKKLALAAALLPNPDLLFLDEPFEGVDAVTSRVIRDMLAGFVSRGSTVFLTSHVLEIVEKLCTHVGIIAHGRLVEQASLEEIRQSGSLESRFLEKVGTEAGAGQKLAWLEETAP